MRIALMLLATASLSAELAVAQGIPRSIPRYVPPTPTTSPYLNLFPGVGSPVSNYYGIVRPQERARALTLQQQRSPQESLLEARITELEESQVAPTGQRSWYTLDSQQNAFRNTSHYYTRWDSRRVRNARPRR